MSKIMQEKHLRFTAPQPILLLNYTRTDRHNTGEHATSHSKSWDIQERSMNHIFPTSFGVHLTGLPTETMPKCSVLPTDGTKTTFMHNESIVPPFRNEKSMHCNDVDLLFVAASEVTLRCDSKVSGTQWQELVIPQATVYRCCVNNFALWQQEEKFAPQRKRWLLEAVHDYMHPTTAFRTMQTVPFACKFENMRVSVHSQKKTSKQRITLSKVFNFLQQSYCSATFKDAVTQQAVVPANLFAPAAAEDQNDASESGDMMVCDDTGGLPLISDNASVPEDGEDIFEQAHEVLNQPVFIDSSSEEDDETSLLTPCPSAPAIHFMQSPDNEWASSVLNEWSLDDEDIPLHDLATWNDIPHEWPASLTHAV